MSRSNDNLSGSAEDPLLASTILDEDEHGEDPHPLLSGTPIQPHVPPQQQHRKTQSLFATPQRPVRARPRHHRHQSSIGELMQVIQEGVQEEAMAIQQAWNMEVKEVHHGRRFFLDMSMSRSLSVLPEDIPEFAQEAVGRHRRGSSLMIRLVPPTQEEEAEIAQQQQQQLESQQQPQPAAVSVSSYLALLSAVLAVSSNGTALALLHAVHPALKLFWRMSAVASVLLFFAVKTLYKQQRVNNQPWLPQLTATQWLTFFSAAVCFFLHTLLLFTALTLTSIGNAVIGANSQALLLVLAKLVSGQTVVWMEGLGVLTAFGGCILCAGDEAHGSEHDSDPDSSAQKALWGDLLAILSAGTGVLYLTFAKAIRPHLSVTVFMFLVMLSGCLLCFLYILVAGIPWTMDNHPQTGLFGWMTTTDNHVYIVLYIAIICNVIGTMGFVRSMEFFDNIIIAVATLLEPMIATLIAFTLGVGHLPGLFGWTGNALVAVGTFFVVYPSMKDGKGGGGGH